ncbi:MAG: LamG domain-containing protein [Candidatus Micrarchaeota archaeon]|nr:LamG domain-containing protein [Candidatus Micrarchaeota archaeon]
MHTSKLQSAMEYLMTYGWAILAIAIVMVSLYSLGIFNAASLQPTATPGSCDVVKTVAQTALAGQCANLIPKYVARFNGANSYIDAGSGRPLTVSTTVTISAWVYAINSSVEQLVVSKDGQYHIEIDSGRTTFQVASTYKRGNSHLNSSTWYNMIASYNGTAVLFYLNGVADGNQAMSATMSPTNNTLHIGDYNNPNAYYFNGMIANVQIYNSTFDSAQAKALYQEGIGGTPISLQSLIGWWPLNGNANDYSGNNNQGTATSTVVWNANWQGNYTAPKT